MRPAVSTPTAILLVDIQEGFKHPTHWGESRSTPSFESKVEAMLSAARAYNGSQGNQPCNSSSSSTTVRFAANLQVLGGEGGVDGNGEGVHGVMVVRDATAMFTRGEFDAETVHAVSLASLDGEFARVVEAREVLGALGE
ncbi:hypothetical protein PpBr36_09017 [Pyricularia pennisetigena]|uniref:hypothetical protein n=1 Tax=Pyricularia pennisetigena TaxID=1578925 RepID=UPI001154B84D|nr:hypothetical protein PpBr36_09017 [Pyricularia pennisetigena]TLS24151.1 hypothetical protein PpBr36_09017 [Pyricularia pennisetigena]